MGINTDVLVDLASHQKGLFTWSEWADVLSSVIHSNEPDTPYYQSWLDALEKILVNRSLLSEQEVRSRTAEWERALLATPHGKPIELGNVETGRD